MFATSTRSLSVLSWVLAVMAAVVFGSVHVHADEAERKAIDSAADLALQQLYSKEKNVQQLADKAVGVLVFPEIKKAGLGIGGETGKGVMRSDGVSIGYYQMRSVSVGLQAGVQTYSSVVLFMTEDAFKTFESDDKGYEFGVDGSVAIVKVGASGQVDTASIKSDVVAVVYNEAGLMANLSIEGSKIKKLDI